MISSALYNSNRSTQVCVYVCVCVCVCVCLCVHVCVCVCARVASDSIVSQVKTSLAQESLGSP